MLITSAHVYDNGSPFKNAWYLLVPKIFCQTVIPSVVKQKLTLIYFILGNEKGANPPLKPVLVNGSFCVCVGFIVSVGNGSRGSIGIEPITTTGGMAGKLSQVIE